MVALETGCATCAARGSRSIQREICIGPAEFYRYRMRLSVSEAVRWMEYKPVIRTTKRVSQILAVQGGCRCTYQRCTVVQVDIHRAAGVIGVPCPAFDCVAALSAVTALKIGRLS